jgi:coronin-1B/1C/6
VFGTAYKREQIYENLRISRNAWDTNLCKVNSRFMSVNLESGGGGQFAVLPLELVGKLPPDYPVFAGHTAAVLDTDFNPYNDCMFTCTAIQLHCVD